MSKIYEVTLVLPDNQEIAIHVDEQTFILDKAAEIGIDLPHMCLQGWCVSCAGRVLNGSAFCVDNHAALRYYPEDKEAGFVLLCTAKVRQNCHIATHQAKAMKIYRQRQGLPVPRG